MNITVIDKTSKQRLSDLLVSALEGGSNYWYFITETHYPETMSFRTMDRSDGLHPVDALLNKGGYLVFKTSEDDEINGQTEWRLDLDGVRKAMRLMANTRWKGAESFTNPKRFYQDFVNENDDAETADVFLQIALFGEVVFG